MPVAIYSNELTTTPSEKHTGTVPLCVQDQRQELHRAIHGEGYGYNEVEEVIKELFGK